MFAWDDLKHFLAFARMGSMLAAAKSQGVNHSTVYRRLAELEKKLGGRLVERQLTGYRLTELGQGLLPYAERVEQAVMACERYLAASDKTLTGIVRVTCSPTVGDRLKRSALLESFHARHPGLQIELMLSDRHVDLAKREADIAIRGAGRELGDETLVGRKIAEGPWAVYASRSYVERYGRPERPEDIGRHRVVRCDGLIAEHPAGRWLRAVAPHATVTACSESWPALVLAVKSGVGLAPLSTALGDIEAELVRVIHHVPELVTYFYLVMHPDMQRVPRVRAFFDFVVSEIKAFQLVLAGRPEQQTEIPNSAGADAGP